jgi:hypothetical protein
MFKLVKKIVLGAALISMISTPAFAATDGTLGTTSQGDLDITLTIQDLVRISGLADATFGNYAGSGDLNDNQDICVYRNDAAGQYTVTATAVEGAFTIDDGGGNDIAYNVYFNDVTGTTGEVALSYNTASATQSGANTSTDDCSVGGDSANVHVELLEANLLAAPSGAYSGTLVLTVAPV